jgi:RNA polymerase sigma-70 factor (sigma-E family)
MQLGVRAVTERLRRQDQQNFDRNELRAADPDSRPAAAGSAPDRAAAVSALYAEHALGLIRLAHIMLGSPSMAEDVVQDAFCGLYRRWPHLNDPAKALGYVRSSVLNGCRSVRRLRPTVELEESHQRPAGSAEAAILTAEERQHILRALRGLPPRQREVLALRFYLDLSDDEIAVAMGIGKGTVRSAAHRGLISLRRILEETP